MELDKDTKEQFMDIIQSDLFWDWIRKNLFTKSNLKDLKNQIDLSGDLKLVHVNKSVEEAIIRKRVVLAESNSKKWNDMTTTDILKKLDLDFKASKIKTGWALSQMEKTAPKKRNNLRVYRVKEILADDGESKSPPIAAKKSSKHQDQFYRLKQILDKDKGAFISHINSHEYPESFSRLRFPVEPYQGPYYLAPIEGVSYAMDYENNPDMQRLLAQYLTEHAKQHKNKKGKTFYFLSKFENKRHERHFIIPSKYLASKKKFKKAYGVEFTDAPPSNLDLVLNSIDKK